MAGADVVAAVDTLETTGCSTSAAVSSRPKSDHPKKTPAMLVASIALFHLDPLPVALRRGLLPRSVAAFEDVELVVVVFMFALSKAVFRTLVFIVIIVVVPGS